MDKNRFSILLPSFRYPLKNCSCERLWHQNLLNVLPDDPINIRKAMYKMALYFKREFSYDFVQYAEHEEDDNKHKAFLFYSISYYPRSYVAYGGFVMRYRDHFTDVDPHWALQWIWLHPYERSKGRLQSVWPFLKKEFGEFITEPPLSRQMKFFLRRMKCYSMQANYERLQKK